MVGAAPLTILSLLCMICFSANPSMITYNDLGFLLRLRSVLAYAFLLRRCVFGIVMIDPISHEAF